MRFGHLLSWAGRCELDGRQHVPGLPVCLSFILLGSFLVFCLGTFLVISFMTSVSSPPGSLLLVAALPGIVRHSIGLPDLHSGYGFAIGNVAAFDMDDPKAVVSPGGVGFDINCGVRLIRTNLSESDVAAVKDALAQSLFDHIPVGVGSQARHAP